MACEASFTTRVGLHPSLSLAIRAGDLSTPCHFQIDLALPAESFIDFYELQERSYLFSVPNSSQPQLDGPTSPDARTRKATISLRNEPIGLEFNIPLHMRYPVPWDDELPPVHDQHLNVMFASPTLSWVCASSGTCLQSDF